MLFFVCIVLRSNLDHHYSFSAQLLEDEITPISHFFFRFRGIVILFGDISPVGLRSLHSRGSGASSPREGVAYIHVLRVSHRRKTSFMHISHSLLVVKGACKCHVTPVNKILLFTKRLNYLTSRYKINTVQFPPKYETSYLPDESKRRQVNLNQLIDVGVMFG